MTTLYITYKDHRDGDVFFNPAPSNYYVVENPEVGSKTGQTEVLGLGTLDEMVKLCDEYDSKLF